MAGHDVNPLVLLLATLLQLVSIVIRLCLLIASLGTRDDMDPFIQQPRKTGDDFGIRYLLQCAST